VEVQLQTNLVLISPEPDEEIVLVDIPVVIRRTGFVPAQMELLARGEIRSEATGPTFRIQGWNEAIPVKNPPLQAGATELRARVDYSGAEIVLDPVQ